MSGAVDIAKAAKAAFEASQLIVSEERVKALHAIRSELEYRKAEILAANHDDLQVCLDYADLTSGNSFMSPKLTKRLPKQRWMPVVCPSRC